MSCGTTACRVNCSASGSYPTRGPTFQSRTPYQLVNGARESLIFGSPREIGGFRPETTSLPAPASDPIRGGSENNRDHARNSLNSLQEFDFSLRPREPQFS